MEKNNIQESRNFLAELEHKISKEKENEDLKENKHRTKGFNNTLDPKKNNTADMFLSHNYTKHSGRKDRNQLYSSPFSNTFKKLYGDDSKGFSYQT